jgi:ABC-type bacteriocin/lantibiotic exporter with double-glycine peptidase domain
VVINLLALATPLFMMTVYNKVISHGSLRTLDALAVGMASLFCFELVLRALRGHLAAHTGARLEAALGSEVVHHLTRLPLRAFETTPAGQTLERLRQLDQLRGFLTGHLPLLVVDLAFVGLFVAALFALTPPLALVTVLAMPPFVLLSALAHRGRRDAQGRLPRQRRQGLEPERDGDPRADREGARARGRDGAALRGPARRERLGRVPLRQRRPARRQPRPGPPAGDGPAHDLRGCPHDHRGRAHGGRAGRRHDPLGPRAGADAPAVRRLDAAPAGRGGVRPAGRADARAGGGAAALGHEAQLRGEVRLEAVSFRYADGRPDALADVDLAVGPGTILGVAGPPGSGKSTLVKLLLGLERPTEGRVLLDEIDLRQLPPAVYRGQIGVVPQEVQLFAGTIASNIAIGAADRSPARIVAAARLVGAHDFVQRLPEGYETVLDERGTGLSLGQRQLIAVARALVRNPRLLVLDEATSALDQAAEAHLLGNLRRAGGGRTVVLVTHRPAALAICDRVVVLEQGRVAREGPPAEIVATLAPRVPARRGGLQVVAAAPAAAAAAAAEG